MNPDVSGRWFRVEIMSTPSNDVAQVPDPRWLQAKRRTIRTQADLDEFDAELGLLVDDLDAAPGASLPAALAWTALGVVAAILIILAGWGLSEAGAALWESLSE